MHAETLRVKAFWSEVGRILGCRACEAPGPEKSYTRECQTYQDAWDESRRNEAAEEAKRGVAADPDTRPLDPSSSSTDPKPKRTKTTTLADTDNSADKMDVDNFQGHPQTLIRVARNALHIRGEDGLKFDVNEEAWPNVDLVIHSSYEGPLIDGLPADKIKAGDEREIKQMKDLQLYSRVKETDILLDKSILLTG